MECVLAEINGWKTDPRRNRMRRASSTATIAMAARTTARRLSGYPGIEEDGSTACGCWIYSGVLGPRRNEQSKLRVSRKIIRPRLGLRLAEPTAALSIIEPAPTPTASRGASAKNWSGGTQAKRKWTGIDDPDFKKTRRPTYARPARQRPRRNCRATHRLSCTKTASAGFMFRRVCRTGRCQRIMNRSNRRSQNALYPARYQPAGQVVHAPGKSNAPPGDPRFPYVLTHIPPDRASHRRRDEPLLPRTWRNCSLRCSRKYHRNWPRSSGIRNGD